MPRSGGRSTLSASIVSGIEPWGVTECHTRTTGVTAGSSMLEVVRIRIALAMVIGPFLLCHSAVWAHEAIRSMEKSLSIFPA